MQMVSDFAATSSHVDAFPMSVTVKHTVLSNPPSVRSGFHENRRFRAVQSFPPLYPSCACSIAPGGSLLPGATAMVIWSRQFPSSACRSKNPSCPMMNILGAVLVSARSKLGAGSATTCSRTHFISDAACTSTTPVERPLSRRKWWSTASRQTTVSPMSAAHGVHAIPISHPDGAALSRVSNRACTVENRAYPGTGPMEKPTFVSRQSLTAPAICRSFPRKLSEMLNPE
mmetsp:Transcript_15485/g.37430  ORF Transcript_15485/g.37430 Transcript_15485/m.37430 type:complete len:229 (-) Transcript_15485:2473-3159(-)